MERASQARVSKHMSADEMELVAAGFAMAEGPRWHQGAIVLNDIHAEAVMHVDASSVVSTLCQCPSSPICIGFLRDDMMLVSSLKKGRIWRVTNGELATYANLEGLSAFDWGDMVVDAQDRIYIANQGMCYPEVIPDPIESKIYLLAGGDTPVVVADEFLYANGLAITPDEKSLIVAESFGHRLWRLPIHQDGTLGERTLVVQLPESDRPDGICCDAEGAIWSANATGRAVIRCTLEGIITNRISTGHDLAIGCILGGHDGRDLYITTAATAQREQARAMRSSALWRTRVAIPAGGRP